MDKKKKRIVIGIVLGLIVLVIGVNWFQSNKSALPETNIVAKEDDGIDYFEVPDMEQVYINGIVQPDQTESFAKDTNMTSKPEIKVNNGDIVDVGTELFVYEDKEITKEIENQNNTLSKLATKKQNIYNKWNRAITTYNNTAEEDRMTSLAAIDEQYQTEIDAVAEEILFANQTVSDLSTKQFVTTVATFKGRVSIPETKDENAPILRLTSEGLYFAGKVNEKDLLKIAVGQTATLSVVSSGVSVLGKISYIDDNPPEADTNVNNTGDNSTTMSSYSVKLSLDSLDGIKNGYHMQATINLEENKVIEIPKKAIHEKEGKKYVLVNDFGSVIRRDVQVGEEKDDLCVINFGLESADRIIVSSREELNEGDLIGDNGTEAINIDEAQEIIQE